MTPFPEEAEMDGIASAVCLTDEMAEAMGRSILDLHERGPSHAGPPDRLMADILAELRRVFSGLHDGDRRDQALGILARADFRLSGLAGILHARMAAGSVRRVQRNLHVRPLLAADRRPRLSDALDFDDRLAASDVLYDLAFLLVDLCQRGLGHQANVALGACLRAAHGRQDEGLAALPLFLATRALIRAMVLLQRAERVPDTGKEILSDAGRYLDAAGHFLRPSSGWLLAVGGPSATGRTVLARGLAPRIAPCPGAVHLRTDTEGRTDGAARDGGPSARSDVTAQLLKRARAILAAGRDVVLDAPFGEACHRDAARAMALDLGLRFHGLWLSAPETVRIDRVPSRYGAGTDAASGGGHGQIAGFGAVDALGEGWTRLDVTLPRPSLLEAAAQVLHLFPPAPAFAPLCGQATGVTSDAKT